MYHPNPSIDYCVNRYLEELAILQGVSHELRYPESSLPFPKAVIQHCLNEAETYARAEERWLTLHLLQVAVWYLACFTSDAVVTAP